MKNAIKAIGDSKPVALLQMRRSIDHALALAESMDLLSAPKQQAISNFIQEATGVDPSDPTYKFHSQGILDTLQKLLDEFTAEKADLDAEFAKSSAACKSTISDLKGKISKNDAAMEQLEKDIITLTRDIAKAREDLVNAEATLTDDQLYMKDLTKLCEERAKDWDQRTQLRAGELEALEGALKVLKDKVSPMDQAANERAMLMQKNQGQKMSLALRPKLQKAVSLLQNLEGESSFMAAVHKSDSAAAAKQRRAVALLKHAGNRLHSQTLAVVAMHVASDPFTKVKKLIQQLIERLLAEATAEATKKGFCDTELGKANSDRDFRMKDAKDLNLELEALEIKKADLEAEIELLTDEIETLDKNLKEATTEREASHDDNIATISTAKMGLKAVTGAIQILKVFYKNAAKAGSFVQYSPVDEDTSGPGFEGNYAGKQDAAKGIFGMLEVIKKIGRAHV